MHSPAVRADAVHGLHTRADAVHSSHVRAGAAHARIPVLTPSVQKPLATPVAVQRSVGLHAALRPALRLLARDPTMLWRKFQRTRILLLAGALLLAALQPSAAAEGVELAGDIAYTTPFGQLAVVDPSGGEPRLLSPVGATYRFPTFASDGQKIAAIGADDREGIVGVFDADGLRQVYRSEREPPIYAYWSPDGESLSFIAVRPDTGLGLHIISLSSQLPGQPRLVATGNPFYWAWERDADALLAHIGITGEGSRLAFVDPQHGIAEENLDPPGFFQAPGISPSGRYLAYASAEAGGIRRVVVASHPFEPGEIVRRELAHEGFAMLSWNPVADILAFVAPTQPASHWFGPVRVLDAATGLLEPLVDDVSLAFFWSPDGAKLAWLSPVATGGVQQVAQYRANGRGAAVSRAGSSAGRPDGGVPLASQQVPLRLRLQVVHLEGDRAGQVQTLTTFAPSATFVNEFLPFFDQYSLSHRIWSPDSEALAIPVLGREGVVQVVVVGLDGTVRRVAEGDMPFWNVR